MKLVFWIKERLEWMVEEGAILLEWIPQWNAGVDGSYESIE